MDASAPSASVASGLDAAPSFFRFAAEVTAACFAASAGGSSRTSSYSVRILLVMRALRLGCVRRGSMVEWKGWSGRVCTWTHRLVETHSRNLQRRARVFASPSRGREPGRGVLAQFVPKLSTWEYKPLRTGDYKKQHPKQGAALLVKPW